MASTHDTSHTRTIEALDKREGTRFSQVLVAGAPMHHRYNDLAGWC